MPNPKDYLDDEHTYVHGYVRRKHAEDSELSPEELKYLSDLENRHSKLVVASWIIHLIAVIISGIFAFTHIVGWEWNIFFGFIFVLLSILLGVRIKRWWDKELVPTGLNIASWVIHIVAIGLATVFALASILATGWRILSCFVFGVLLFVLIIRVVHWWQDNI